MTAKYGGEYTDKDFAREVAIFKRKKKEGLERLKREGGETAATADYTVKNRVKGDEYGGALEFLANFHLRLPGGNQRCVIGEVAKLNKPKNEKHIEKTRELFENLDIVLLGFGLSIKEAENICKEIRDRKTNKILVKYKSLLVKLYIEMRNFGYNHCDLTG